MRVAMERNEGLLPRVSVIWQIILSRCTISEVSGLNPQVTKYPRCCSQIFTYLLEIPFKCWQQRRIFVPAHRCTHRSSSAATQAFFVRYRHLKQRTGVLKARASRPNPELELAVCLACPLGPDKS